MVLIRVYVHDTCRTLKHHVKREEKTRHVLVAHTTTRFTNLIFVYFFETVFVYKVLIYSLWIGVIVLPCF